MKQYKSNTIALILSLMLLSLFACNDNDENITYEDEVIVKEKIQGKWTVSSMIYESNYAIITEALNESSKTLLSVNDMFFTFVNDSLITTSIDKNSQIKTEEDLDPYIISNGNIYVYDVSDSVTYIYKYTLRNSDLILKSTLSRSDVIEILKQSSEDAGNDYSTIINSIPDDLSIDYSFKLKR